LISTKLIKQGNLAPAAVKHDEEQKRGQSILEVRPGGAITQTCDDVHVNVIKTVMRHCNFMLTMDTYGHLLPVEYPNAIGRMPGIFGTEVREAAMGAERGPN
jgi:hypothetical protein